MTIIIIHQNNSTMAIIRGETIHRNYGASQFSGHDWVTLIREINLILRNQLSLAKSTYKNIILNNYAKILPEYY